MTNTNRSLNARQLARYNHFRRQGHGALRAYRAARAMIGGGLVGHTV